MELEASYMKKINIGVIGSGFIVPVFIEQSKRFKEYHLVGIWGRHEEKLIGFKDEFEYYTTDLNRLLSDEKIDVVYVALPNKLHFEYAYKALNHGKHVILEKPFTVTYKEAKTLIDYAHKHELIIFEAITTIHNPLYKKVMKMVDKLGEIKMIECDFSQYSRRYDRFRKGEILPAFDKKLAGGALYDLGVYNIHFVTRTFGEPYKVEYLANIEKGVDTSGVLVMDYKNFKAVCIAAKDCKAESYGQIQGDKGFIRCETTTSRCGAFRYKPNSGKEEFYCDNDKEEFTGWKHELKEFRRLYMNKDFVKAKDYNDQTLIAVRVLEKAMRSAGLDY